jgi:type I restriction enzyme M protein
MEEDELGGRESEESLISDESSSLLPARADSDRSWTVTRDQVEARNFDLKAVNPNAKGEQDQRTPAELLDIIEAKQKEIAGLVAALRMQN